MICYLSTGACYKTYLMMYFISLFMLIFLKFSFLSPYLWPRTVYAFYNLHGVYGLISADKGWGSAAGPSDHGNEILGILKCWEFLRS
jgi:hypothetical protein